MLSVIPHVVNVYLLMINLTLVIYVNSMNFGKQTEHLQLSFSCPQVLAESGCVTTDCRIDVYFDDR